MPAAGAAAAPQKHSQNRGALAGPSSTTPQSRFGDAYFFFEDLFVDFLVDFLAGFLAAILFTTFHAVRDLSVAPTWQQVPDRSGKLCFGGEGVDPGKEIPMTFNID